MSDEDDNEQSYHDLYLGDNLQALKKDELGSCPDCSEDVKPSDDYINLVIFKKVGISGSTHTEFYHLKCWNNHGKQ
jgi:hypothetical protein